MRSASAEVPARAALAGNPSDGYGGRTLAVTLDCWRARVEVEKADHFSIGDDGLDLESALAAGGGDALSAAAVLRLTGSDPNRRAGSDPVRAVGSDPVGAVGSDPFALRWTTDIPRQVGLAGSSAIVIATMRAVVDAFEVDLAPHALALLAWQAETEELGIAAGPQDRVVQSHGGLVYMDFDLAHGPIGRAEQLDPAQLPPLFVAWRRDGGDPSGTLHASLRERDDLAPAMARLADHAATAATALRHGDHAAFGRAMNASFDTRHSLGAADRHSTEMVHAARECGCAANQAGSGGAVVGVMTDGLSLSELRRRFAPLACDVRVMLAHRQG